jgi:hypothetical protein
MKQTLQNHFINELSVLAQNQSPTLLKIREMKAADIENIENVKDPIYLANACAVLATDFIQGIDQGDISFSSDSDRMQIYWLIQILVDIALDGQLEQLFAKERPHLTMVSSSNSVI